MRARAGQLTGDQREPRRPRDRTRATAPSEAMRQSTLIWRVPLETAGPPRKHMSQTTESGAPGHCTEQHNVRALGAHFPFSHQCLGCEHFRTDPSHLPDLYAYLERLLETCERLRVAVPELAEWARTNAIPADAEIRTVRTLIGAGEGALEELAPGERAKLLELFRVLRATRARMDSTLGIEHIGGTRTPSRRSRHPRSRHCHRSERSRAAGRGIGDRAASMTTAKRRTNTEKHERVQAVIAQIKDQGREDQLKATVIARRAGVHRSFVSNHFAGQLAHAKAEIQARFITGLSGQTALSAASLRVEMETARHQAREAQQEIRDLRPVWREPSARRSPTGTRSTASRRRSSTTYTPKSSDCSPRRAICIDGYTRPRKSSRPHDV